MALSGAGVASAQTVIARKAPAGSTVELVLNESKAGTATADERGDAKLPFSLPAGKTEFDAYVHVDECEGLRRIIVVERGQSPALPEPGCARKDVIGLFLVKKVSNLVVDTGSVNPTVWLRQGSVDLSAKGPARTWDDAATGLIVWGGAGLGKYRDALLLQCGNVTPCNGGDSRTMYNLGADFWIGPFIAAEGSYLRPADVNASGGGTNYRFTSFLESHITLINGKVGVPVGIVRIYGHGGTNYALTKTTMTETIDDLPVTINGVVQTIPGGTQTIETKTAGWGWQFGGGVEVWVKNYFAIYGQVDRIHAKGEGIDGPAATFSDFLNAITFGGRYRFGR